MLYKAVKMKNVSGTNVRDKIEQSKFEYIKDKFNI